MTKKPNDPTRSHKKSSKTKKYLPIIISIIMILTIATLIIIAIILFFRLPQNPQSFNNISTASLIQMILAVVSGVMAVYSLWQTRKNIYGLKKAKEEYAHQVHIERRIRHTNAKKQLTGEDDVTRRDGIDTLLNLVDEWLTDDTCTQEEQKKESQDIINTLCKYIQSIPPSCTTEDLTNGNYPPAEKEIRIAILKRINSRSKNNGITNWSNFHYDFSDTFFFYSVNFSKCNFGNHVFFNNSTFAETVSFSGTTFARNAVFSDAVFKQKANFFRAYFMQGANFSEAVFAQDAYFSFISFSRNVDFSRASFLQNVDFSGVAFKQKADFSGVAFKQKAGFRGVRFQQKADFSRAFFKSVKPDFADSSETIQQRTQFAALTSDQEAHSFRVYEGSTPILLGITKLNGVPYRLPIGAVLFDPGSWDEEKQEYTRVSEPAK